MAEDYADRIAKLRASRGMRPQLESAIDAAAQRYRLPEQGRQALRAIAEIESSWGQNNVGQMIGSEVSGAREQYGKRAVGPYQFMPSTWNAYGRGGSPMDPQAATDAAARHLLDSYAKHKDWTLAALGHHQGSAFEVANVGPHGRDYLVKLRAKMGAPSAAPSGPGPEANPFLEGLPPAPEAGGGAADNPFLAGLPPEPDPEPAVPSYGMEGQQLQPGAGPAVPDALRQKILTAPGPQPGMLDGPQMSALPEERPGFFARAGAAAARALPWEIDAMQALGDRNPQEIDPATGRVMTGDELRARRAARRAREVDEGPPAAETLGEKAADLAGGMAGALRDPLAVMLGPVGAGRAMAARVPLLAGTWGGYEGGRAALEQVAREGEVVRPGEVAVRGAIGAVAAPALDGIVRAAAAGLRSLRQGRAAGTLDAETAAAQEATLRAAVDAEAARVGADPAAVAAAVERAAVDEAAVLRGNPAGAAGAAADDPLLRVEVDASGRPVAVPDASAPARLAGLLDEGVGGDAAGTGTGAAAGPGGASMAGAESGLGRATTGVLDGGSGPFSAGLRAADDARPVAQPAADGAGVVPPVRVESGPVVAPPAPPSPAPAAAPSGALARAAEYERLAQMAEDVNVQADLLRQAAAARAEAQAGPVNLSAAEKNRRARVININEDDLLTVVRKSGGLDMSDPWVGELSGRFRHIPRGSGFGLPGIERTGARAREGLDSDRVVEVLYRHGFIEVADWRHAEEALLEAASGERVLSRHLSEEARVFDELLGKQEAELASREFGEREAERAARAARAGTDAEWEFVDGPWSAAEDEAVPMAVLTPDGRTILVKTERVTLADLERIADEESASRQLAAERAAEDAKWAREAELEAEPAGDPGGNPGVGDEARVQGDAVSGSQAAGESAAGGAGAAVRGRGVAQPGLPGIEPQDTGRQAVADLLRSRAAAVPEAPGPEGFVLSGSDRAADELAARGQQGLFDGPGSGAGTLYSNPFLLAAGRAAQTVGRGVAQAPGNAAAGGFAGGVTGGVSSDAPLGAPAWWRDVALGTAAGVALAGAARGAGITGQGGALAEAVTRLGRAIDRLPGVGRGPDEVIALKRRQRAMESLLDAQVDRVGAFLHDRFSPSERGQMADLIEGRGIVRAFDAIHRQAAALDDYLADVGQQMKDLGMLGEGVDTSGGYLHRYYTKHLGGDVGAPAGAKQARAQQGLSGSYTIRRGTVEGFDRAYLSPGASAQVAEFERLSADLATVQAQQAKSARGGTADALGADLEQRAADLRTALRDLQRGELRTFTGTQDGKPRQFVFTADEVGRVDTGLPPVLARIDRPEKALSTGRDLPDLDGVSDLAPTDRRWTLDGVDAGGKVNLHRDWTAAEREAWGEIPDAGYRFVRGMAEASHDLSLARFFGTLARRSEWALPAESAPAEWVRVPSGPARPKSPLRRYGALAGMAVRPDVWNGVRNYGRSPFLQNAAGDAYRGLLGKWKAFKTVYNPVTHFNNIMSNVHLSLMAGYGPRDIAGGLAELRRGEASPLIAEARQVGLFSGDWVSSLQSVDGHGKAQLEALAEALRTQPEIPDAQVITSAMMNAKAWWVTSANAVRAAQGPVQTGAAVGRMLAGPVAAGLRQAARPVRAGAEAMQNAYRFEDDVFKMAVFRKERAAGRTPEQAAEMANRYFFDYSDLPDAVKWVRDFPIGSPFISYTWKAVPAIVRTAIEHPERVAALVAGYEAMNYAALAGSESAPGMGPGEYWETQAAEQTVSAPWDRGRAVFGARNTVHVPGLENYTLALARVYPLGNPFAMEASPQDKALGVAALASTWGPDLAGGNPITRLIVDLVEGTDWKGKPIWPEGAPTEERVRAGLNYVYQALTPSNPLVPGSYPQQKIIEGLAQDKRAAEVEGREPNMLVSGIVDTANAVSQALGGQQFTGLSRDGQPASSGEAMLGSVGVKVRPFAPARGYDWEARRPVKEAKELKGYLKSRARLLDQGRISPQQFAADEAEFNRRFQAGPTANQQRLDAARDLLDRQGRWIGGAE